MLPTQMAAPAAQIVNSPAFVVDEALDGIALTHAGIIERVPGHRVLVRRHFDASTVSIVSGGGSGHEPAHAGYVGQGALAGVVAGDVFASPPTGSILKLITRVAGSRGVLVVVKNYTGDRLNFGAAVEKARSLGIKVEMVVVGDDCALPAGLRNAGRRGLCGTIFVHKIAGAYAAQGASLEEVAHLATWVAANVGTVGVALSACQVPGRPPSFNLPPNHMEVGLGIHGEAGIRQMPVQPADELAKTMTALILEKAGVPGFVQLPRGANVALILNNLGGTSPLELSVAARSFMLHLTGDLGLVVQRCFVGTFMTSIAMAGVSVSILCLDGAPQNLLPLLDAETDCFAWPRTASLQSEVVPGADDSGQQSTDDDTHQPEKPNTPPTSNVKTILAIAEATAQGLIANRALLDELDRTVGDGDCGSTMASSGNLILSQLHAGGHLLGWAQPAEVLLAIGELLSEHAGGSLGVLSSIFLTCAGGQLSSSSASSVVGPDNVVEALHAGALAVMKYGGAQLGDRTIASTKNAYSVYTVSQMLDVLLPVLTTVAQQLAAGAAYGDVLQAIPNQVDTLVEATKYMQAHAGRSSYLDNTRIQGTPDPGAMAVAIVIKQVVLVLQQQQ